MSSESEVDQVEGHAGDQGTRLDDPEEEADYDLVRVGGRSALGS